MTKQQLLENRLGFITCHREKRESLAGVEIFHGKPAFFKNAFLFKKNAIKKVPSGFQLHVPDWVSIDDGFLKCHGWQYSESMIYMVLKNGTEQWPINGQVVVKRVHEKDDIIQYCQTQSVGFAEGNVAENPWYPAILASSLKNATKSNHQFYLASLDGKPAGVTLAYYDGPTMGIYSVATVAACRKKGVGTSLMKEVVQRGLNQGVECITLQTMAGTYAEPFYEKLGFERVFECKIYQQQTLIP